MSDRLLVLVRHGQSEWNLKNLFTGWKDVDLTQNGIAEARAAGRKLKAQGISFDIAFTSALIRAQRATGIGALGVGGHLGGGGQVDDGEGPLEQPGDVLVDGGQLAVEVGPGALGVGAPLRGPPRASRGAPDDAGRRFP